MSFKMLRFIVGHLRKNNRCPFCSSQFIDESIFILATAFDGANLSCSALFFIICPKCFAQAFVMVEANNVSADRLKKENIRVHTKPTTRSISSDEILDMHNFLKNWKGDLKELFKEI